MPHSNSSSTHRLWRADWHVTSPYIAAHRLLRAGWHGASPYIATHHLLRAGYRQSDGSETDTTVHPQRRSVERILRLSAAYHCGSDFQAEVFADVKLRQLRIDVGINDRDCINA